MEVFIRDEDIKWDISYSLADSNNSLDCKDHKPIIVKSLEQHDSEIRKPLEEEIERLLQEIKDLECLVKLNEQAKQKVIAELEKFEHKERLFARNIDNRNPDATEEEKSRLYALSVGRFEILGKLNRKLNEMKGEK